MNSKTISVKDLTENNTSYNKQVIYRQLKET